jgi:putative acyl-CoA dehydrogenase
MSATHEVFNQSTPLSGVNLLRANRPLRDALDALRPQLALDRLEAIGAEAGSAAMQQHARLANVHAPVLRTHDRVGRRIDEVEFHPSYHALLGAALGHGLHSTPWSAAAGGHLERAAAFMLFTECEPSVLCPVSMTYAVTPALRANPSLLAEWGPRLADTRYDPRFVPGHHKTAVTMGMGMTEKQGGSDVRANTSRAESDGEDGWGRRFALTGHKWFLSAPMCDAFLVLAHTPAGLSCLFVPRFRPDGTLNDLRIQRLKHKLGNQANASSEVEFERAGAWLVGEEGRGVAQILAMGTLTRLDCALGTAGLMRQALSLALHHCGQRQAFGRPLIRQPLMRNVLADLALESEAATALALRLAHAIDVTEGGAAGGASPSVVEHEQVMRRVLTPIAKFWICKRGSAFAQEAMECLGGNGYVEEGGEGVMARIYREMPLNSIWEGAANIMALDLLRALRTGRPSAGSKHGPVADALMHELAPARVAHWGVARAADALIARLADGAGPRAASAPGASDETGVAPGPDAPDEAEARRLARDVALLLQAALLHRFAPEPVFDAFCNSRLDGAADVFGLLPAGAPLDAILQRAWAEA